MNKTIQAFLSQEKASDLHIRAGSVPYLRINGHMKEIPGIPIITPENAIAVAKLIVGEERFAETYGENANSLKPGEIDSSWTIGEEARFRVNVFIDKSGMGMVLRKIPNTVPDIETLGFFKEHIKTIKGFAQMKQGIILVTGQTGSGKSTTMAAIVKEVLSSGNKHVISIEDPIEFIHNPKNSSVVTQREVGIHTDSFASGLRASLREDPDVILIGEIRDRKTAEAAMEAASTGHLVIATLHTSGAAETIERIVGLFPPEDHNRINSLLSSVLVGIVSQRLVSTIKGGRALAYELLHNNSAMRVSIRQGRVMASSVMDIMNSNLKHDRFPMIPLNQCLYRRMVDTEEESRISQEAAVEVSPTPDELLSLIDNYRKEGGKQNENLVIQIEDTRREEIEKEEARRKWE